MSGEEWPAGKAWSSTDLEAAAWCFRLKETPTEALLAEFQSWIDASKTNAEAFANAMLVAPMKPAERQRIEQFLGQSLPALDRSGSKARTGSPAATIHTFPAKNHATPLKPAGRSRTGRRWATGAIAAAAMVALTVGLLPNLPLPWLLSQARAETYATGHGDIRRFTLADGSLVTLDTDSRVEVVIGRSKRHALLRQGRARFVVAADLRPFTIRAGNGDVVTAKGEVDVGVDGNAQVELRLRSGSASVKARDTMDRQSESMPLTINRPVLYAGGDFAPRVVTAPTADTRDWPSGWVEYRTIPLGELIREANRYAKTPIILDDPKLARLTASGRFQLTETDRFASRIAELFQLRISRRAGGIHLRPQ
ncbi:FecR family protein [Sphingobium fuliginis]|uniref:Heme uptake transmembrane sensor n=1 Tax=Sphingobium fuliginis (strain ATCC 27551) TaxID=336203 RepID=A0A292ZB78_SPHSA|nr:FecR domain-containing protein [Sphingobium fuliginis]GAY20119.1 heme uptake transmembrane sensor [Sphingobium fuliginis]